MFKCSNVQWHNFSTRRRAYIIYKNHPTFSIPLIIVFLPNILLHIQANVAPCVCLFLLQVVAAHKLTEV